MHELNNSRHSGARRSKLRFQNLEQGTGDGWVTDLVHFYLSLRLTKTGSALTGNMNMSARRLLSPAEHGPLPGWGLEMPYGLFCQDGRWPGGTQTKAFRSRVRIQPQHDASWDQKAADSDPLLRSACASDAPHRRLSLDVVVAARDQPLASLVRELALVLPRQRLSAVAVYV